MPCGKCGTKCRSSKPKSLEFRLYDCAELQLKLELELLEWLVNRKSQFHRRFERVKNIVYFDLETQKSADEVGGWNNIARMGMSIGVTFSTARGDYKIYGEKQVNDLLTDLQRADLRRGLQHFAVRLRGAARLHVV